MSLLQSLQPAAHATHTVAQALMSLGVITTVVLVVSLTINLVHLKGSCGQAGFVLTSPLLPPSPDASSSWIIHSFYQIHKDPKCSLQEALNRRTLSLTTGSLGSPS